MWVLRIGIICTLLLIFYQDFKERLVSWFLYPLFGVLAFALQLYFVAAFSGLLNTVFNLLFVLVLISVCFVYAKVKLKIPLNEILGIGDILFFIFAAFAFSMLSFFILFVFALVFSLAMHQFFKYKQAHTTVPLAGYMALFFCTLYGLGFFTDTNFLYAY